MKKRCSKCEKWKDINDFHNDKRRKDGKTSSCKECVIHNSKKWYEENKDKMKEYRKKYYEKNKDEIKKKKKEYDKIYNKKNKDKKREYDIKNKDKISECRKKYYEKNKDERKEYGKKYYKKNKDIKNKYRNNPVKYDKRLKIVKDLAFYEDIQESADGFVMVKCMFCGKWMKPTRLQIENKLKSINKVLNGESNFYCNDGCKKGCPVYRRQRDPREKDFKIGTSREVQPELRRMVFKRDNWECIKCGETYQLECHHIEGIQQNPIESADLDMCITACYSCHKKIHKEKGCRYFEMRKRNC